MPKEDRFRTFCTDLSQFAQNRILFNNSEALHTTMSIKTHLHIKAFSTQEIYNKNLNARYMYG